MQLREEGKYNLRAAGDTAWSQPHEVYPAFSLKQFQRDSSRGKGPKPKHQRSCSQKVVFHLSYTEIKTSVHPELEIRVSDEYSAKIEKYS